MTIEEFATGTWTASSVGAGEEEVVNLDVAGVYLIYLDAVNFTAGKTTYFYAHLTGTGLTVASHLADKEGTTNFAQIVSNAGFIRTFGPHVVADGQEISITGDQDAGASTFAVPWVAVRIF